MEFSDYLNFFIACLLIFFIVRKISSLLNLLDHPTKRKRHKFSVPYTGGIFISLSLIYIVFYIDLYDGTLNYILSYTLIVSLVGLIDDKISLGVGSKLLLLIFPIYLLSQHNLLITHIGDYEYIGKIELGSLSLIFTIICCLFLINAVNYSDGVDGFATTISISTLLNLILLLSFQKNFYMELTNLLSLIIIPLIIFLFFNFNNNKNYKIFLGDSGSLMLGFFISFILIFIFKNLNVHPAILVWTITFFVYEFISVNLERIINKKPLFKPGRDHFHYQVLDRTKSLKIVNILGFILNIVLFFFGFIIYENFGSFASLIIFFLTFFMFFKLKKKLSQ